MIEILKVLSTKDIYYKYKDIIDNITLDNNILYIYKDLESYYEHHDEVDWSTFGSWFRLKHPTKKQDSLDVFDKLFERLGELDLDTDCSDVVHTLTLRDSAARIASYSLAVVDGEEENLDKVNELYYDYLEKSNSLSDSNSKIVKDDLSTILDNFVSGGGLDWRLEELNVSAGPIRKGDFIVIAATPETGKTTMLASEASHMVANMTGNVLWFNNEEEGRRVKFRCIQAALGLTKDEIEKDVVKAWKDYLDLTGDRILIYDEARLHYKEVERVLSNTSPGLIIFDQLRKVKGFKTGSEVDTLVEVFGWARELSKKYCPVIAVHQADGSAIGKEYIDIENLYYSRIGIQGEADMILTIADPRTNDPYQRNLNICKNKLSGGKQTEERWRHSKWTVKILPEIARYESP